jgi:hypothetical protein
MADRYIPEHRRNQFKAKAAFKPEELRRRREEQQVEIRKQKREENLAKRRGIGTGENRPGASLGAAPDSDDDTAPTESQVCNFSSLISSSCFSCLFPHQIRAAPQSASTPPCMAALNIGVRLICHLLPTTQGHMQDGASKMNIDFGLLVGIADRSTLPRSTSSLPLNANLS